MRHGRRQKRGGGLSEPSESIGEDGNRSRGADSTPGFAQLKDDNASRYAVSAQGVFHLTPTELQLLRIIEGLDGKPVSRAALAAHLHRNSTVIGRLLSRLRREGIIESAAIYEANGGQTANRWTIAPGARPLLEGERPEDFSAAQ